MSIAGLEKPVEKWEKDHFEILMVGGIYHPLWGRGAVSWFYFDIYIQESYKMFPPDIWQELGRDLFNGHRERKGGRIPLLYQISRGEGGGGS